MLTDTRMDGRTDDGQKVITIAHPEQSSDELIIVLKCFYYSPVPKLLKWFSYIDQDGCQP